jgi:histidyl-tRNA synthetase
MIEAKLREAKIGMLKRLSEFDRPLWTAVHFGFVPVDAPRIRRADIEITRGSIRLPYYNATERSSVIRMYNEDEIYSLDHPITLSYRRIPSGKGPTAEYSLHFIGPNNGFAEALLIRTTLAMLWSEGYRGLAIDINCIGDKESISTYEKELSNYVRKSLADLPGALRQRIRDDIFELFHHEAPEFDTLRNSLPSSIAHLSTQSRIYFKEVLEHIEALDIEFTISSALIGERNHSSHTIFTIKSGSHNNKQIYAVGYRYSRLARLLGYKKEIPMIGVTIFLPRDNPMTNRVYKESVRPKFYLMQLGREAKLKSVGVIELLRRENIRVHHLIGKDGLAIQLADADKLLVPYHIIIGHKEALDNTATVRNVTTRAQNTVSIEQLPKFLKCLTI